MKKMMEAMGCFFCTKKIAVYFMIATAMSIFQIQAAIFQTKAIAEAMEHTDQISVYILPAIGWIALVGLLMPTANYCRQRSNAIGYTEMNSAFTKKVASVNYDTYVKTSCSNIITLSEQMVSNCNVAMGVYSCILSAANTALLLLAIYKISSSLVPVLLAVYAIIAVGCRKLFGVYGKTHDIISKQKKQRNHELYELINGFSEVRSFNTQKTHVETIIRFNNLNLEMQRKNHRFNIMINVFINLGDTMAIACGILYISKSINAGIVSSAVGMALIVYLMRVIEPIMIFLDRLDCFAEDLAKIDDFIAFMNLPDATDGTIELTSFNHDITLNNVSFSYDKSDTVLDALNLTISKGESIGICGESGGGKSTLMKLLEKFYAPTSGCICIDGIDIQNITNASLRSKMGIVSQDVYIFDTTIFENIKYGLPNATEYEVVEACKKASLYDFILSLPDGFQTQVGPKGLKLSGGQKQRISLARIFLRDPEIVLLDEATSALDNESERIVQQSLMAFRGKTIITIAHRLSTIRHCDRIVVLDNHHIAEIGTHDELMKLGGIYTRLHNIPSTNGGKITQLMRSRA